MSAYLIPYLFISFIIEGPLTLDSVSGEVDLHLQCKTLLASQNAATRWRSVLKTFDRSMSFGCDWFSGF